MKVAVIGGRITGLTAAYRLAKHGHRVTVYEKSDILGGLAQGFTKPDWEWNLESAYHHLFTNDSDILHLMTEIGLEEQKMVLRPVTATLFNGQSYPLDSPLTLLQFPGLSFTERIRTGLLLAAMKLNPWWKPLESYTAKEVFERWGGSAGWKAIWEPLMIGKFGDYADSIAASWLWARIKKRTSRLVYIKGGFATFINRLVEQITENGGEIHTDVTIRSLIPPPSSRHSLSSSRHSLSSSRHSLSSSRRKPGSLRDQERLPEDNLESVMIPDPVRLRSGPECNRRQVGNDESNEKFEISLDKKKEQFDRILLTTPTPIAAQLVPEIKPELKDALTIPHLFAQVLILETKEPILRDVYWLNITDRSFPFLAVVQHTNLIDKRHYGGQHITYIGNYLPADHPFLKLTKDQLLKTFEPYLKKLNPSFSYSQLITHNSQLFVGPFAQPVHQKNYSQRAPKIKTSIPGLFLANMDSIYPWDRGTNYAVELGEKAANLAKQ